MTIVSVHVSDVGATKALRMVRGPGAVPGLVAADVGLAAPLRTGRLPRPMPGRVALVAFWDGLAAFDDFVHEHPFARELPDGWSARLDPLRAYGSWPGLSTEVARSRAATGEGPVVVLTLGRLRLRRARQFLRASRPAEAGAVAADGFRWGTALARPPFVATLSIWDSAEASAAYAFGPPTQGHAPAIAADRATPFHRQSAFIRLRPVEAAGSLRGRNPLPEGLLTVADRS